MRHINDQTEDACVGVPSPEGGVAEEMSIMAEIGRVISSTLKIDKIYGRFAQEARKLIAFDQLSINFIDPNRELFTIGYVWGLDIPGRRPGDKVQIAGSIGEAVVNRRSGMLCSFVNLDDLLKQFPHAGTVLTAEAGIRSLICVPLISAGNVIGTLHFRSEDPDIYSERELRLAEGIGRQIAGAIANAQLYASLAKTEADLREKEERIRVLSNNMPGGLVYQIDSGEDGEQWSLSYISKGVERLHGVTVSEALNDARTIYRQVLEEDRRLVSERAAIAIANISSFNAEVRRRLPSGDIRWSLLSAVPRRLPNNHLVWDGIEIDITDRKQAEEDLRKKERYFRALIDCAGDAIFILNIASNRIVDCNRQACISLGYSRDKLLTLSPTSIEVHLSSEEIEAIHAEVESGQIMNVQGAHQRKDGSVFPVEIRFSLLDSPESHLAVSIVRDISERIRNDTALRKSRETAERLAQEDAIIAEIGRKISSTLDINDVYERLAAESKILITYDRMAVNLINAQEGTYTLLYISGLQHPQRRPGNSFPLAGSVIGDVWKRRAGIIIQGQDEREINNIYPYIRTVLQMGVLSLLSVPLIANDEVIGSINYRSKKPNAYTEADLRLVERIGRQIAGAITNAKLYTDLKKTEQSFREGKELYSRLINAVPDAVLVTDTEGRITFANEVTLQRGGYADITEIIGKDVRDYVVPEEREEAERKVRLMLKERPGPQPLRLILNNGRKITAEINADVLRNPDGAPFGMVVVSRDVTDRDRMQEKLRESEANYRFLTDNMNDIIWVVDLNLKMAYVNKSIETLFGYAPEERMAQSLLEHCTPESYDVIQKAIAADQEIEQNGTGDPGRVTTIETEFLRKDGSSIWLESLVRGVRDARGVLVGYHGVSRNITQRKKLEREILRILNDLEARVRDRTIELEEMNTALRVLLKKGEQDLRKKDQDFMENIDQLIIPFLQKLQSSTSIEQQRSYARIIESNLAGVTSPFVNRLADSYRNLTPMEIQIVTMVRNGMSSKEIAAAMNVSIGTVATHRNNIRRKLNLKSRSANLRSHLLSLI